MMRPASMFLPSRMFSSRRDRVAARIEVQARILLQLRVPDELHGIVPVDRCGDLGQITAGRSGGDFEARVARNVQRSNGRIAESFGADLDRRFAFQADQSGLERARIGRGLLTRHPE